MSSIAPLSLFPSPEMQKQWIKAQAATIPVKIMQTVIASDLKVEHGFKVLAKAHIKPTLSKDLDQLDQTIQDLYSSLFRTTWRYIQENSPPLLMTLGLINEQMHNEQAGGQFLGAFVYDAIMTLPAVKEHCPQKTEAV